VTAHEWPESEELRWRFVYETEQLLCTRPPYHRILSYSQGRALRAQESSAEPSLPDSFVAALPRLESIQTNIKESLWPSTDKEYRELWEVFTIKTRELVKEGALPASFLMPERLEAFELLRAMLLVISRGLSFHARWQLLRKLTSALQGTAQRAKKIISEGGRGVCFDYAQTIQTLFFAAKKVTGRFQDVFVFPVYGQVPKKTEWHIWNWFVDTSRHHVIAFDLTWAD
jgi:hypothetical protein